MNKIKLFADGREIPLEIAKFSGGEVRVKILDPEQNIESPLVNDIHIEALLLNSDDVMSLVMLTDAAKRFYWNDKIRLTMPYIPYARQDRACARGESFSLNMFAIIINSLKFSSIVVYDAHSKVSTQLIERCINVEQWELVKKHKELNSWIENTIWSGVPLFLVCPDKGAIEKTKAIYERYSFRGIIYAEKIRNPENGQITGTTLNDVPGGCEGAAFLICDDICDFGTTFVELAKVLHRDLQPLVLNLYVTHGIFSGGKPRLLEYFDNVWSTTDFQFKLDSITNKWSN